MIRSAHLTVMALLFGSFCIPQIARGKDPKLKPEELVSRHLQSLGTAEALGKIQSRALNCMVTATTQFGRAGTMPGKASVLSKGTRTRVGIVIDVPDYPGEQFGFDGAKPAVGSLLPGTRSPLGTFLQQNGVLLREGLMGGVLTTAWPLLDLPTRKPLLSYDGLKKIEGKPYHAMKYRPNKGAMPSNVTLYFEPETFRHVRTRVYLEGGGGSAATAPRQGESARSDMSRFELIEEFGDFREIDGLVLPHSYTIRYSGDTAGHTVMASWVLSVLELAHNPTIDDKYFSVR